MNQEIAKTREYSPRQVKADPDSIWVRSRHIVPIVILTATAVTCYMRFEYRMARIEEKIEIDTAARSHERDAIVKSVDGVRDQIRQVFVEVVSVRQMQHWIDMARALNRDKNPAIVWPDIPR